MFWIEFQCQITATGLEGPSRNGNPKNLSSKHIPKQSIASENICDFCIGVQPLQMSALKLPIVHQPTTVHPWQGPFPSVGLSGKASLPHWLEPMEDHDGLQGVGFSRKIWHYWETLNTQTTFRHAHFGSASNPSNCPFPPHSSALTPLFGEMDIEVNGHLVKMLA